MHDDELVRVNVCLYVPYVSEYETIKARTYKTIVDPGGPKRYPIYKEHSGG